MSFHTILIIDDRVFLNIDTMDRVTLTGVPDTDRYILSFLNDSDLLGACSADSYVQNICNGETGLWYQRLRTVIHPVADMDNMPSNRYKELYFLFSAYDNDRERLIAAIELNDLSLIDFFLERNQIDPQTIIASPLTTAAQVGNIKVVERLLSMRVDNYVNNNDALIQAGRNGHIAVLRRLIDLRDPSLNLPSNLLYETAIGGHLDAVLFLFELGLGRLLDKRTVIHVAGRGYLELLQFLWSKIDEEEEKRPFLLSFLEAAKGGHTNVLEFLLDMTMDDERIGRAIDVSLVPVVQNGHLDTLRFLLGRIPPLDKERANILIETSAETNYTDVMKFLLQQDVNVGDLAEKIAHIAVVAHKTVMLNFLLGLIEFDDEILSELLDKAIDDGTVEIVERLIQEGASTTKERTMDQFMYLIRLGGLNNIKRWKAAGILPLIDENAIEQAIRADRKSLFDYLLEERRKQQIEHPDELEPYLNNSVVNEVIFNLYDSSHQTTYYLSALLNYPIENIDRAFVDLYIIFRSIRRSTNIRILRTFIDAGADVDGKPGDSLLLSSIRYGHTEIAEQILSLHDYRAIKEQSGPWGRRGHSAFIEAIRNDRRDLVEWMIDNGIDLSAHYNEAFRTAISSSNIDITTLLLDQELVLDDSMIQEALNMAISEKNEELIDLLVDRGAQIADESLITAVKTRSLSLVRKLLSYNLSQRAINNGLLEAIKEGNIDLVVLLLESGGDYNVVTDIDLVHMIKNTSYRQPIIELLIEKGLRVDNDTGISMLHSAIEQNDESLVILLLDNGVIANHKSLLLAINKRRVEIIKRLIASGLDPHANNDEAFKLARQTRSIAVYNALEKR